MEHPFKLSFRRFLDSEGIAFKEHGGSFLFPDRNFEIVPVYITGRSKASPSGEYEDVLYLYEDRWIWNREMMEQRILARTGKFTSIFARKCRIISGRENGEAIRDFLNRYHSYGYVKSPFRYALAFNSQIVAASTFSEPRPMLRSVENLFSSISPSETSHASSALISSSETSSHSHNAVQPLDTVQFQSYEWTRYASLPGTRVVGGMGKLLNAFLDEAISKNIINSRDSEFYRIEKSYGALDAMCNQFFRGGNNGGNGKSYGSCASGVNGNNCNGNNSGWNYRDNYAGSFERGGGLAHRPVEVMSYSDTEWSGGNAYKRLGFTEVEGRAPIRFFVDKRTFERFSEHQIRKMYEAGELMTGRFYEIQNKGSKKFLLQIQ